jgi:hypothetical protein
MVYYCFRLPHDSQHSCYIITFHERYNTGMKKILKIFFVILIDVLFDFYQKVGYQKVGYLPEGNMSVESFLEYVICQNRP